jgi:hypothetical protein
MKINIKNDRVDKMLNRKIGGTEVKKHWEDRDKSRSLVVRQTL